MPRREGFIAAELHLLARRIRYFQETSGGIAAALVTLSTGVLRGGFSGG